jgi:hypothetical protein
MRTCALAIAGSRAGGIPKTNTIRSIPEVMYRPAVRRHVTDFSEISPAHAERYAACASLAFGLVYSCEVYSMLFVGLGLAAALRSIDSAVAL